MSDPAVNLLLPLDDVQSPELSIVIPALNEALTIGTFVGWCLAGLEKAGVRGEILIVDSSTDGTAEIALARGARVLKTPRRGLGRAYQDALPFVRGEWILMGDCDCTYDFRELKPFVDAFKGGAEFVMGSRFIGTIEDGAMPPLHRYLGTPVTTWILNTIFGSRFSDIHCGMRGLTKAAFVNMRLSSQSWEYASEMVLKSVHMQLETTEVPIHFLKDPPGRFSHHKREGWFSPWKAAWINLRAMFVYGADFFLFKPGLILLVLGLLLCLTLAAGPVKVGRVELSLNWMLLGLSLSVLGLQSVYQGIIAKLLFDYTGRATERWRRVFAYDRAMLVSALGVLAGLGFGAVFVRGYLQQGMDLSHAPPAMKHLGVFGLLLVVLSLMTFTATLMVHATALAMTSRASASPNKGNTP